MTGQPTQPTHEQAGPEGRGANPKHGPAQISLLLATVVFVLLLAAVVLALVTSWPIAVAVGALGVVLFITNPAVWAAVLRSKERSGR